MHPRVLQLIMDSLRYWVTEMHVDGFRFDLASALARELHEVDRLSRSSTSSTRTRHLPGQADRRALGPRRRRLPGRQFPRPLDRVERAATATPSAASGKATSARSANSPTASPAAATSTPQRPQALRQHQLRHRARRLHPARPRQLQRQAQRGERRGTTATATTTTLLELRRRRSRRSDDDDPRPTCKPMLLRADSSATTRHSGTFLLPGRADARAAATNMDRTQPTGNNNAYVAARTTRSAGLPRTTSGRRWSLALDTFQPDLAEGRNRYRSGSTYQLQPRSIAILKHPTGNHL
jgi:hypothetical protein